MSIELGQASAAPLTQGLAGGRNRFALLGRAAWTVGGYGVSSALRLGSNVVLTRLLAPEIFGIMVVLNSIKVGIELLTDVGIEQNIVQHRNGLQDQFFNTAWSLQILRGLCLTALLLCLTPVLGSFYGIDRHVFLLISFAPLVNSLASTSIFVLSKNLEVKARNLFELTSEFVGFLVTVALALVTPTVWALVLGAILTLAMRAALSYFIPHPRHRIVFDRAAAVEILSFGKWITISSFVVYAATNLDRIYLGKLLPLQILGVFGLARAIADLPPTLAQRLTYQVVFPAIARARARSEQIAKSDLAAIRLRFLVFASATMATMIAWSDWAIRLLYDQRYQAAGWMLFVLMMGAWVAVLSSLNEAVLLGFGHPKVNGLANVSRVFVLSLGLPAGYFLFGLAGAVIVVAASELSRYVLLVAGQERICFSFWKQDTTATTVVFACLVGWLLVRHAAGLGMPWNGMVFEGQVP